ncbi:MULTISPECIES: hypothetical protein [Streptomyces]|uniref:hypothetical protein n=1 Tax=Streptomyces TaxID=1883 RepID=UPI00345BEDB5
MSTMALAPLPFGMRHLIPVNADAPALPEGGGFDEALQIGVTAAGNPWHALMDGDTKTETTPDGHGSGTDGDGTDLY